MNRLPAAMALLLLGAGLAPAAVAKVAPKVPCRILVDAAGDSEAGPPLDIVSADLGTSATHVTAVLRVPALARANPEAVTGQSWYVEWAVGSSVPLFLGVRITPTSETFQYGHREGSTYRQAGVATGFVDMDRDEVRITAPFSVFAAQVKMGKGTRLSRVSANTYWFVGADTGDVGAGNHQPGDTATTAAVHVAGTPTCVPVGR